MTDKPLANIVGRFLPVSRPKKMVPDLVADPTATPYLCSSSKSTRRTSSTSGCSLLRWVYLFFPALSHPSLSYKTRFLSSLTEVLAQDLKLGHYMKIPPRETFKGGAFFFGELAAEGGLLTHSRRMGQFKSSPWSSRHSRKSASSGGSSRLFRRCVTPTSRRSSLARTRARCSPPRSSGDNILFAKS